MLMKVLLGVIITSHYKFTNGKQEVKDCRVSDPDGCTCNFTDGSGLVNLRSLGNKNNTPRFKDVQGVYPGEVYSYNPCYGFKEGACKNASMCFLQDGNERQIGDVGSGKFEYVDNYGLVAVYDIQPYGAVSMVHLICNSTASEPVFRALGSSSPGFYLFEMTTRCACPGVCSDV